MSKAVSYSPPLAVVTSQFTVSWFCVSLSTAVFYSLSSACQYLTLNSLSTVCQYHTLKNLSTLCQYLTLYRPLVLFQYVHCCFLKFVHCLSVLHTVRLLVSCHSLHCCLYSLSTVCQYYFSTSRDYLLPCFSNTFCCFTVTACTVATVILPFKFSDVWCKERVFCVIC